MLCLRRQGGFCTTNPPIALSLRIVVKTAQEGKMVCMWSMGERLLLVSRWPSMKSFVPWQVHVVVACTAGTWVISHTLLFLFLGWSIQHQNKTYRYICVGIAIQGITRHNQQPRRPTTESGRLLLYRLKLRKHDMQFSLIQVWHEDALPAGVFAICPHPYG